jgi:hypothetical protein
MVFRTIGLMTINMNNYEKNNNNLELNLTSYEINKIRIKSDIVYYVGLIDCDELYEHENCLDNYTNNDYIKNTFEINAIIVDFESNVIIDGHHRVKLFKQLNAKIPALFINYKHQDVIVNSYNDNISKEQVINAHNNTLYKPKSTKHMIKDINNELYPIISISPLFEFTRIS